MRLPLGSVAAGRSPLDVRLEQDPWRMRVVAYRAAAEWLDGAVPARSRLPSPEIGSLGYYDRGPVIDACGLVSPEALPLPPEEPLLRDAMLLRDLWPAEPYRTGV